MKRLHVVNVAWEEYQGSALTETVGFYLGERKGDILLSDSYSKALHIHDVVFAIAKSRVRDIKTLVIMDVK